MKFTDAAVRNLKPDVERYEVWASRGLGLRVSPKGRKSWIFMYRFDGRARRLTLGKYPAMSVADAHSAHGKALAALERGKDPGAAAVTQREEARKAPTVTDLAAEYLEQWARPRKKSWREDQRILGKDVLPHWGKRKARDITRRQVVLLLDDVKARGAPIQANRTLAIVRRMFNFAVERGVLDSSPVVSVKAPSKERARERVLSPDEIRAVWTAFDIAPASELVRCALRLMLVTGQRKGEILNMEWSELDLQGGWWSIAGEKVKNGHAHRVPLASRALELLDRLMAVRSSAQWVFPSPVADKPISGPAIDHAVRNARAAGVLADMPHWTPHDLRRTVATSLGELGFNRLIQDKVMNHVDRSVGGIYDRHSYDGEKRQALDAWAKKLTSIIEGRNSHNADVVPINTFLSHATLFKSGGAL